MTQAGEAALAAEAGLTFVGIGLVTDYDAGVEDDPSVAPVTQDEVFGFLAANADNMRRLLHTAIPELTLPDGGLPPVDLDELRDRLLGQLLDRRGHHTEH